MNEVNIWQADPDSTLDLENVYVPAKNSRHHGKTINYDNPDHIKDNDAASKHPGKTVN
jgi:hypothetical protein